LNQESLIRRTLFHLGEEPWAAPDTLHRSKHDKALEESRSASTLKSTFDQLLSDLKRTIYDREKPTLIAAGGTIDTEPDPDTGTRIPNHNRQKQRMQAVMAKTHHQRTPFYPYVPDSSNIVPSLQQKLMESIFTEVEQNLKLTNSKGSANFHGLKGKTKQTSIPADEIPKYFNTSRKWGRGVYVTHGSDTLAIDAALAAYLFRDAHLVSVWTGAWNSRNEPGFDGALNEKRARQLAEHPYTPPGAYVVIGNHIHLAAKAMKINNHPFNAKEVSPASMLPYASGPDQMVSYFASLDDQPVGYFDEANQPHFYTRFLREQEKRAGDAEQSPASAALIARYRQSGALNPPMWNMS